MLRFPVPKEFFNSPTVTNFWLAVRTFSVERPVRTADPTKVQQNVRAKERSPNLATVLFFWVDRSCLRAGVGGVVG